MTMTRQEEETLRRFANRTDDDHLQDKLQNSSTIYAVVQALCSVALKAEAIKKAQEPHP